MGCHIRLSRMGRITMGMKGSARNVWLGWGRRCLVPQAVFGARLASIAEGGVAYRSMLLWHREWLR